MKDPRETLSRASEQYKKAEQALDQARQVLVGAVVEALRDGVPPTDVVELSLFSPAYVRVIARQHDIPPARGGPRKKVDHTRHRTDVL